MWTTYPIGNGVAREEGTKGPGLRTALLLETGGSHSPPSTGSWLEL